MQMAAERPFAAPQRDLDPIEPDRATPVAKRLISLDVFRGITIAAMLLVNNSGRGTPYAPLEHADWDGWTPTDLIFPFFLFIVGVATPFSLAKRGAAEPVSKLRQVGRIWVRALTLFLLGLLLASSNLVWPFQNVPTGYPWTAGLRMFGFVFIYASIILLLVPWPWRKVSTWLTIGVAIVLVGYLVLMSFVRAHALDKGWPAETFGNGAYHPDFLRVPGVLQRIGICYGVAATIAVLSGWRTVLLSATILCAIYSGLMLHAKFPGKDESTVGLLTKENNFARYVDEFVLERRAYDADGKPVLNADGKPKFLQRHSYTAYPDNEGIVSTLPAIASVLFGILVGYWLRTTRTAAEHAAGMLAVGLVVMLVGVHLGHVRMPINKVLWTPSFTVFTTGMAMLCLGVVFWLIEVCHRRAWAWPFKVMGMNAIAAFVLAVLMVRVSRLVLVREPTSQKDVPLLTYANNRILEWMDLASAKWQSLSPNFAAFDTPQNESLAYSVAFVLFVWFVMWLMYVCRVFAKV